MHTLLFFHFLIMNFFDTYTSYTLIITDFYIQMMLLQLTGGGGGGGAWGEKDLPKKGPPFPG